MENTPFHPNAFVAVPEARQWLIDMLKTNEVEVTFTKKDGTDRVMKCTLDESKIPVLEKKTDRVKTVNQNVLPVFDIDANAWRSFRLDSIKNIWFKL